MKVDRNFLSLRKVNEMCCRIIVNIETFRAGLNIDYFYLKSFMYFKSALYDLCVNTVLMIYLNKFKYF